MIEIVEAGPWSTVQDAGRRGVAHWGVSLGGAADPLSHRIANRLVGNPENAATIEMTLRGAAVRFLADTSIAVTGSDFGWSLDGAPVPMWESVMVRAGATLRSGMTRQGTRSYLAVAGGIAAPEVLGSRSAWRAERLRAGDRLALGDAGPARVRRALFRPEYRESCELRVLPGVDAEAFTPESREKFVAIEYTVTPQSNRTGIRLAGELLADNWPGERVTEGVSWGAVQLPSSGQPIILMNDQTTTGGYPQLAHVITADRGLMGQLKPGNRVRFRYIGPAEALDELLAMERRIVEGVEES